MQNPKNKKNVNLVSLGCAKNMVDSEILLGGLNQTSLKIASVRGAYARK